jgi:hypothetical protein
MKSKLNIELLTQLTHEVIDERKHIKDNSLSIAKAKALNNATRSVIVIQIQIAHQLLQYDKLVVRKEELDFKKGKYAK